MSDAPLDADAIAALFTAADGRFAFGRWGRPIAPVVFGLADDSLGPLAGAMGAVFRGAGAQQAPTDPGSGANLIVFLMRDWAELAGVPDLDRLTGVPDLPGRLAARPGGASRYRLFRHDANGAIRACITLAKLTGTEHPAALGEALAVNAVLTFAREVTPGPALARLIRAAYDPRLPLAASDPSVALRLAARLQGWTGGGALPICDRS